MLPKEIWERLPRFEHKKILWWCRLRWVKYHLSHHIQLHTPAPIRFAIKTALVAFAALCLLPSHPVAIPAAMTFGLIAALATHTPDPRPAAAPSPRPLPRSYIVRVRRDGSLEIHPKTVRVRRDGTIERIP